MQISAQNGWKNPFSTTVADPHGPLQVMSFRNPSSFSPSGILPLHSSPLPELVMHLTSAKCHRPAESVYSARGKGGRCFANQLCLQILFSKFFLFLRRFLQIMVCMRCPGGLSPLCRPTLHLLKFWFSPTL